MNARFHFPFLTALAALTCGLLSSAALPQDRRDFGIYRITDFGALADGKTLSTGAIQKAVNECHANGGGTVVVSPGEFITGTIVLLSNVHLFLESGAVLKGSADMADYRRDGLRRGILFADDADNISISGRGCIWGIGSHFHDSDRLNSSGIEKRFTRQREDYMDPKFGHDEGPIAHEQRPGLMIDILRSSNVSIRDITARDSPEYAVRIGSCDNVTIAGLTIMNNPLIPNNDGIHCTTSRNVHIADCHVETGDDAIIVTGFPYDMYDDVQKGVRAAEERYGNKTGRSENVTVTNCTLSSRSAGIRIGYGDNDIRDCTFQNIVIFNSNRGIGVFARDRGSIQNIIFSNIIITTRLFTGGWWGAGEPIHVSAVPQTRGVRVGKIGGITFTDIVAESEAGIVLYGVEESPIENIVLNNVRLLVKSGPLSVAYGGNIDLRPTGSPGTQVFSHDIPGIYARFLLDSRIEDCELTWKGALPDFFTHGIELEDSKSVAIRDFQGTQAPNAAGGKRIEVRRCEGIRTE